jgi:hypothetical protein
MTLSCSSCHEDVPEGAKECPHCGAGLHTVMFGKGRGLTRTLIGKAVELRDSIPWATASAVVMVRDEGGKPKPRPKGIAGVVLGFALFVLGAYFLFRSPSKPAEPVVAEASPPPSASKPEPPPAPEPQPPAVAAAPARSAPAKQEAPAPAKVAAKSSAPEPPTKAPAGKSGTLVVRAAYRGKPVVARVKVNGEAKGMTPLTVALAPSKYTLTLESTGFRREKRTDVQVVAGRKAMLAVDLRK